MAYRAAAAADIPSIGDLYGTTSTFKIISVSHASVCSAGILLLHRWSIDLSAKIVLGLYLKFVSVKIAFGTMVSVVLSAFINLDCYCCRYQNNGYGWL